MIRTGCFILALFFTLILSAAPTLHYTVSFPEPQTHYVNVSMEVTDWRNATAEVSMAAWTPGSYLIREFAGNVEQVTAVDGSGNPLVIQKVDKDTWEVKTERNRSFTINYKVYAFEYTVRTSFVDADHAMINPASVFMYLEEYPRLESQVRIEPHPSWKQISTTLTMSGGDKWQRTSESFDELADSPIEVGNHEELTFEAEGVTHRIALIGESDFDHERFIKDLKKLVTTCTDIFGSHPLKGKEYLFFIHHTNRGGGGLEHKNNTSVIIPARRYHSDGGYNSLFSLLAHEYFHLWNAKRLRPEALGPFDYAHENYTTLLWQVEGFTSYYDELCLHRMGLIDVNEYLNKLNGLINEVANTPGNTIQPVAESSWDAWIKYYRQNENSPNSIISYYSKGATVAACLDILLNHQSEGKYGLDTVLHEMYRDFYLERERGFTERELLDVLEKFAGIPLDTFMNRHVHGTEPINYDYYLGLAGLDLVDGMPPGNPWLGVGIREEGGQFIVGQVVRGSTAWEAGLNVHDEILAIDGLRANNRIIGSLDEKHEVGDTVSILINRDGYIRTINAELREDERKNYIIMRQANPSNKQKQVLKGWLGITFD